MSHRVIASFAIILLLIADCSVVTLLPPITDLFSPRFNLFVVLRIAIFQVLEEALDRLASGGEDCQTDHDEKDPLQNRKEEPKDSEPDEAPTEDPYGDSLHFIVLQEYIIIIAIRKNH